MKCIVLEEPGSLRRGVCAPPAAPGPGEARVRVHRIGVCGTDMHAYRGRQPFFSYPRILGHELGVEVIEVGEGERNLRPGDRCAVEPYLSCGGCIACRRGKTNCCVSLKVLGVHVDGGMRPEITVPAARLHPSPTLSYDQLALVETLGIGAHAVDRATPEPGEWTAVIGAGPIGLAVTQFAALAGAQIAIVDSNPDRLAFAVRQSGTAACIQVEGREFDLAGALTQACGGDLPTLVFDATGNPESMAGAFRCAANGGRLVFVGLTQGEISFTDSEMHRRELALFRTRNSTGRDFRRIVALIEGGALDTSRWITHRATFGEAAGAFPTWLEPESRVVKAIIEL